MSEKNKKIDNMANKAASVLMCAAMIGSTAFPVSTVPVLAADDVPAVEVTETTTEVEVAGSDDTKSTETSTKEEEKSETKTDEDKKSDETTKSDTETVDADSVYITMKDGDTPVAIKKSTLIGDALSQVLGAGGISIDLTGMRMDVVAGDGTRTVVFGSTADAKSDDTKDTAKASDAKTDESGKTDAATGSLSSIGDIYDYVDKASAECSFVVYNAQGEICRLSMSKGTAEDRSSLNISKVADTTTYKVTYDANGGKLDKEFTTVRANGEKLSYFDVTASYDGQTFDGWYDAKEGGNKVAEDSAVSADMTLYAHWKANTATITFDTDKGSEVKAQTANVGDTVKDLPTPEKAGYTFDGWYDAKEGGNKVTELKVEKDVTLYAHWKANVVTITFDSNGGKEVKAQTANVGDTVKDLPKAEKEGATFDGWYDAKEGGNKVTELKVEKDVTLYAHWKANAVTITFDSNGGDEVKAQTANVGDTVKDLPTPKKTGSAFDGWYDAKEGGNKVTELKVEKDVTLYAHWKANAVTITFDANGGDEVKAQTANVGDTVKDLPKAERKGYTFDGWYDAKEGGNKVTEFKAEKDVTLYAHWAEIKVTKLELSKHEMTLKSGDKIDLSYTYGPKGATNAEFVWTSSDPNVLDVAEKDGKVVFSYRGTGTTKITIATKDGSLSDSCNVTVTGDSNNNGDNNNSGDNGNGGDATETPTPTPTETPEATPTPTPTEEAVKQLTLNVVMTDGSTKKVTVKDDVKLNDLVQTLGFTSVTSYKYRTATNNTETNMDASTTMKSIAEMAEKEEVLIIGYNSSGEAVGCGKITKTGDDTYTVTLSKDTNVALNTNDGKGKGEGDNTTSDSDSGSSEVSKEGKGDSQATPVKTSDSNVLPIYGGLGALMTTLIGVLAYLKKKALREL